jgi:phosphoribosylpyrophosphate synthetase
MLDEQRHKKKTRTKPHNCIHNVSGKIALLIDDTS